MVILTTRGDFAEPEARCLCFSGSAVGSTVLQAAVVAVVEVALVVVAITWSAIAAAACFRRFGFRPPVLGVEQNSILPLELPLPPPLLPSPPPLLPSAPPPHHAPQDDEAPQEDATPSAVEVAVPDSAPAEVASEAVAPSGNILDWTEGDA